MNSRCLTPWPFLVVLRVDDVMLPEASTNAAALDVLGQHGLDRLMASPTGWSFR